MRWLWLVGITLLILMALTYVTYAENQSISLKVVNEIPLYGSQVFSLVYNPVNNDVYVILNNDTMLIVSAITNQVINAVNIPISSFLIPEVSIYDPNNSNIYIAASNPYTKVGVIYVFSTSTNTVITTISMNGTILNMVYNPINNYIYVVSPSLNEIIVISGSTNNILVSIPISNPGAILYDQANGSSTWVVQGISRSFPAYQS